MNAEELATYAGTTARVVAPPAEVALLLRRANEAGRLVTMTPPVPHGAGRVAVTVHLRPLPRVTGWTRRRVAVAAAAAVAVLAAIVLAVMWLLAHTTVIAAGLVLAGLAVAAGAKAGVCPGVVIHCRGCKHGA